MKAWDKSLQSNYGTPSIELVSGKGAVVKDNKGIAYLDFLAGIATSVLGHAHPAVVKAVSRQIATLGHVSNFYAHPNVLELSAKLAVTLARRQMKPRSSFRARQVELELWQPRSRFTDGQWARSH